MSSIRKITSLRILGPSNGGVGTCIAGVRVLKIGTFEGSGYLGFSNFMKHVPSSGSQAGHSNNIVLGMVH